MAFALRSLTARRYRIEGDVPPVHSDAFRERLADRAFRPPADVEEKAAGWVTADNCLDADFETAALVRGPCAAFALRIDRRRVPSRILRARVDLEWRARRKAERDAEGGPAGGKRKGRRGGREERAELRRQVTEDLLRQTPPSTEVHPVLLLPRERAVLFLSLSKRANDAFRELFTATFDVSLSALTPYHRALEMLEGRGASEALADVRRTEFARPAGLGSAALRRSVSLPAGAGAGAPPPAGRIAATSPGALGPDSLGPDPLAPDPLAADPLEPGARS